MLMLRDAAGIYTEPEPPRVYNYAMAAWQDTTGRVWNPALEAWQDAWPGWNGLLYDHGTECVPMDLVSCVRSDYNNEYSTFSALCTRNAIDISGYKKMCVEITVGGDGRADLILMASRLKITDAASHAAYVQVVYAGKYREILNDYTSINELDISGLKGMHYISIGSASTSGVESYSHTTCSRETDCIHTSAYGGSHHTYTYKIWLE